MRRSISHTATLLAAGLLVAGTLSAGERSYPIDCLPDRVVAWEPVSANPDTLFGAPFVPGVLLGPPGDSVAWQGALSVATLGFGGSVTLAFDTIVIEDGPGPDFVIFENPFFRLPVPSVSTDDYRIFAEPAIVEVSADGISWVQFPYDAQALADSVGLDLDPAAHVALTGMAGLTPTFTGNWTQPNDPLVFDGAGNGGISGAGGDAFDLATVSMSEARFVRVTDADTRNGFAGTAEGFDLDAIVVLHGRPRTPASVDTDGDRLSDREELELYGSNPALADSDGDGVDDGREVAGCRDPISSTATAQFHAEPRLWILGKQCTEVRWSFAGSSLFYDVIRGDPAALADLGASVDLGPSVCLKNDETGLRWACDSDTPPDNGAFYYLVRVDPEADYGRASSLNPRSATGGCP